ncbi:MAG TPA: bifunctional oligoribonuclease/PAP phosphatase NrnA [Planctomycetaceae bacterium]|nr:bifunctional oligoribonuclease/PAP phosphatase NrnA [Planctomycetaceae bacterium]
MPDWNSLKQIIDRHQSFVLSSHVRPDADALGSELAFRELLLSLGKQVLIANPSFAPSTLEFLDPDGAIKVLGQGVTEAEVLACDVHIVLDTSAWSQLQSVGELLKKSTAEKIVIDHHVSSDDLGAIEFKDTQAEATGSMVLRFAKAAGIPVSTKAAFYLFGAIATDTGWFRFPSVSSQTYREIAELIDLGVVPHEVYLQLYERCRLSRHHLAGRILERIQLEAEGQLAYTWVSLKDFDETGAHPVDTEDLVNECLRIDGTRIAFIAVEQKNKQIKFSFRARLGNDVSVIAGQFGGGGHKLAAGASLSGPLEPVLEKVRVTVVDLLKSKTPA